MTFRGNVKERGSQADQVTQNQQKTGCLNSFARCVATSTSRLKQVALIVSRVEWTAVEEPSEIRLVGRDYSSKSERVWFLVQITST